MILGDLALLKNVRYSMNDNPFIFQMKNIVLYSWYVKQKPFRKIFINF